jgi:hypothetical protein
VLLEILGRRGADGRDYSKGCEGAHWHHICGNCDQIYVDAMNREPNVVTKGLGERVVKPATEILWAGFFWLGSNMKGQHELIEETLSRGKRSTFDGEHVGDPSGSVGILDRRSGHTSRPESS